MRGDHRSPRMCICYNIATMHRWIIISLITVLYYAIAWYGLALFDAGLVTTAAILFGFPSILFVRYTLAPAPVLIAVTVFGIGITLLLEGIAAMHGLWSVVGYDSARIFGIVQTEVLIASTMYILFLVLLYEFIFDDGVYTVRNARTRFGAIAVFAVGVLTLLYLHAHVFPGIYFNHAYLWVVAIFIGSSVAALGVYRAYSVQFFDRLLHFSCIGAVPSFIALSLAAHNQQKVFENMHEYLFTVSVFGSTIPFEELLLAFAIPFFVATIYELYLDDLT